jgi:hypothetical protein
MRANPAVLEPSASATLVADEPLYLTLRRGAPALLGTDARRPTTESPPEQDAARTSLLAYVDFVLAQEALYCQR